MHDATTTRWCGTGIQESRSSRRIWWPTRWRLNPGSSSGSTTPPSGRCRAWMLERAREGALRVPAAGGCLGYAGHSAALVHDRRFRRRDSGPARCQYSGNGDDHRAIRRLMERHLPHDPGDLSHAAGAQLDVGVELAERYRRRRPAGARGGEPPASARVEEVASSNWPLAIPIPVLLLAFFIWSRRGRDPRRRPIAVQYEPPPGLSPAEAGTLLDNSADLRDITATMVDLAVRGYLQIEEYEENKLFGLLSGRGYALRRLEPRANATPLAPHEQLMLDGLFRRHAGRVELSDLKDEFYTELPGIKNGIFDQLLGRGFYHNRPDKVRAGWIAAAIILGGVIAGGGAMLSAGFLMTPVPFIVAGLLVAGILLWFSLIMPARTQPRTRPLEQVLGFQEFLRRGGTPEL